MAARSLALVAALAWASTAVAATPPYTPAQVKRGAGMYAGACAMCHGEGIDDGQFAPPLKGPVHAAYWTGKTAEDLLTYMGAMMPPTQPGGLGAQAYADIYAYLLQAGGAPVGDKELPADPAALKALKPTP